MLYRISSRFSEKIMKKNAHSNRICWEYLPCLSPFCFLLFPETFLPGIACSAAWRNINKHYLDSLWKKTLFPSSALRWQISSPTWFEVTHISIGKTSTEIFLTSFVLCKFCGREILAVAVCWDVKDPREAVQRAGNCREHPSLLSRFGCWGLGSDGSDPDPAWP